MTKTNATAKPKTGMEPYRPPTGTGNLFTFKKMKWRNPEKGESDTREEVKFGEEKGPTNKMGWRRKFHVIDGTEHPKLFLQWLITHRKEALRRTSAPTTG